MKITPVALMAVVFFVLAAKPKEKLFHIGQKSVTYVDETRNRPLLTEIWYPTLERPTETVPKGNQKELFKTIQTVRDASTADGKFPLLLVSHGTGGNRFSLTWFVEKMVKEGYIVVSLDHYGNSTFNKIPREFVKWWERAIDVQYVLTQILKDKEIGAKVDTSKIGGVGFSLGGYTNIALAGGYVDRTIRENQSSEDRQMPPEFPETDEIIDFEKDSLIVSSYKKYKDKVKDGRIKAFFVMAPAVGFGFYSKNQTEKITAPLYIVAGKGDRNTPIRSNALNYHNLIASSKLHLYDENVGHYVFLNEPTEFGKQVAPAITMDHPEVDRREIHEKTLELALAFFEEYL
ncbi:alpha/beta hydrolase family protein [Flagellimonas meridianipacifica]|uniref:Putative dienelactone hydrolase n=1 Tax=Flagellimonas meridianipacifica TaxID=1080225 RepID=A0A2T0MAC6_9FLAO|nr:dienelactone hydrolase [Allomuricauda pacifica]PRX54433.1 putative dienelactone hydrolase [Allomuricauda pacifica]